MQEILCQLHHVHFSFGEKIIFQGVSLALHFGEKVGLLGPNGQGKSTLFRILTGDLVPDRSDPPFIFSKASGKENQEKGFSIFHVPQELPFTAANEKNAPTIGHYLYSFYPELAAAYDRMKLAEGTLATANDRQLDLYQKDLEFLSSPENQEIQNQYESYLKLFGVGDWDRPVNLLSGGEQRKLGLALGLSCRSNLILWDEPTNHLDLEAIEAFEEELANSSKSMVIISHDRYLLNKVCNRILHLERGKLRSFEGTYYEYLNHMQELEKSRLSLLDKLQNHMRREDAWMKQGVKARRTRSKKRVEDFQELKGKIQGIRAMAKKQLELSLHASAKKSKSLVEMKDVSFAHSSGGSLLKDLTIGIFKGEKIALLGPNGSGKTTLLKLICGQLEPTAGTIKRNETLKIHFFEQKREVLDMEKTPYQVVGEGHDMVDLPGGERRHVTAYMEGFLFSRNDLHRPLKTFSGGEKNRLQLAMFLRRDADLYIFDEPTNDLDLETMNMLEEKIRSFTGTVLVVGHDRAFLEQATEKSWVLDQGGIQVFEGGLSQALVFLEALKLEREEKELREEEEARALAKERAARPAAAPAKIAPMSQKEKKRLELLPKLIEEQEKLIEGLDSSMAAFDYSKATSSIAEWQDLEKQRNLAKAALDRLYEEYFLLEGKAAQ